MGVELHVQTMHEMDTAGVKSLPTQIYFKDSFKALYIYMTRCMMGVPSGGGGGGGRGQGEGGRIRIAFRSMYVTRSGNILEVILH